jgi:HAD superfamily hydrolase (TIGR01458 family)
MSLPYQAVLFDLSGVLYEGSRAVPGARRAVANAREAGLVIRFVTNTATKCREDVLDKLDRLGIEAEAAELYSAPIAAREYLTERGLRPFCIVHEAIEYEFKGLNRSNPNAVLIGDARMRLHYDSLNRAFQLCHEGAELIAIGKNRYFKTEEKLQLDSGAFIHAIEWAAGVKATIVGKPGRAFYDSVVASTGLAAKDCLMIGDDVEGDILGALDAGLQATMVKTGKYQPTDQAILPKEAKLVDSVADLFPE